MWCEPSNPEWEWEHAYWFDSPEGSIGVLRRCPECGRFIGRTGKVYENGLGQVALTAWTCRRCGVITPDWERSA